MIALFPSRAVALELFGFGIHWYGLLYLAAFVVAYALLPKLQKYRGLDLSRDEWTSILSAGILGVIVGGRLGFVLFYEPTYFLQHPLDIVAVWKGGMSSHGGFLGVLLALWFTLRHKHIPKLALADTVVVPVAIGLACGRIGNFINQELYGTVTTLPWGMYFDGAEGLRHPTQLYAVGKDLLIAGVCFWHLKKSIVSGRTMALFLMLYGLLRFLNEYFRVQDYSWIDLGVVSVTRGQLLTIPLILVGALLWVGVGKKVLH